MRMGIERTEWEFIRQVNIVKAEFLKTAIGRLALPEKG
jgi:hypothetical protein